MRRLVGTGAPSKHPTVSLVLSCLVGLVELTGCGSSSTPQSQEASNSDNTSAASGSSNGTGTTTSNATNSTGDTVSGTAVTSSTTTGVTTTTATATATATSGAGTTSGGTATGNTTGSSVTGGTTGSGGSTSSTTTDGVGGSSTGGTTGTTTGGTGGVKPVGETGDTTIPGEGCTPPGAYANLFLAVSGHTQEETDAKVNAAWNQLYNPQNQNRVYYDGPGADESYVLDTGNNDVRSEGMSYGMMTAVQLDKQTEFDRLWAWVKNHMANGTDNEIAWHCSTSGNKLSSGGAPDGEEYMATALIFAHRRWGDSGRFDYASEAQWVLDLTRTKYFNSDYHLVKFVSTSNYTDGSYILPAFYQVWACFDTENADFWNEAITAGREFFHAAAGSNGVIPDFSEFNGQARGGAGSDAKRCVMNIMMDHNFFAADPWQTDTYAPAFGQTMQNGGDGTAAQFSCNALLGFGLPESSGKSFVDRLWSAQIPTGQYRYYDGTLYMLALLHVSGAFKLYY